MNALARVFFLTFTSSLLLCGITIAQYEVKTAQAIRVETTPKIDGLLDDECWKSAASMIMFTILAEKAKILSTKDLDLEDLEPSASTE